MTDFGFRGDQAKEQEPVHAAAGRPERAPGFEDLASAYNRRIALSGRLARLEFWRVAPEEGHA